MELVMTVRALIAFSILLFCTLWLARQLKIHRQSLSVSATLVLAFIVLFEPGALAFLVWVVHERAAENSALMIYAYTYLKATTVIYLLFILPCVYLGRMFLIAPKPLTLKALRFALILPVAFSAVAFLEVPRMIWANRAPHITNAGWDIFLVVLVLNVLFILLTYLRPRTK